MTTTRTIPRAVPLALLTALAVACTEKAPDVASRPAPEPTCDEAGSRRVVESFGEALQQVSVLAPDSILTAELRRVYAPLITRELMDRWIAAPSTALGREGSSPWPDRIEIAQVVGQQDGSCKVEGAILYVANGEAGQAMEISRDSITLRVVSDGGWRIADLARPVGGVPTDTPSPSDPESADAADAVRALHDYYAAIAAGDYRAAWLMWGDEGRSSGQSYEEFAAGFAETASVEVEVGQPGRIEGAAGSRYVDIPVLVRARTKAGEAQRFEGTYTLRRVVVDGATAAQRRWHIDAGKLRRVG